MSQSKIKISCREQRSKFNLNSVSISPIGMDRDALSPPTIAFACAADLNDLYFNIK